MKKIAIILMLLASIVPVCTIVRHIEFQQKCGGFLKQAADANSVELCLERLTIAIDYIEQKDLTEGYTSILWKTENDNVGFWYTNLKTCQEELEKALDSDQFEKTNVLMKVRESLTDEEDGEVKITAPNGISRYPSNKAFAFGNGISTIGWIGAIVLFIL